MHAVLQPDLSIAGEAISADGAVSGTGFTPNSTEVIEGIYSEFDGDAADIVEYQGLGGAMDATGAYSTATGILFC